MPMRCTKPQLRLFTPWVCRLHKALSEVVGTKACPGLRSGMCPSINLDAGSPPAKRAEL